MEIGSHFAGTPLREYHTQVAWRDMMNYAAAVADDNPVYFDDERPEGIVAHPLFCVALTWPVLGQVWDYIEADDFPQHLLVTQVHYSEHLAFHRPIKAGMALTIRGEIAAILAHRAGTHVVLRLDACDKEDRPIFTEHAGALLRGVRCTDEGRGCEALPRIPAPPAHAVPLWEASLPIDPLRPYIYDGCTGLTFPIHTSRQFARQMGLPGIILQGTATLAMAASELVNRQAGGDPLRMRALHARFTRTVLPGTEIVLQAEASLPAADGTGLWFSALNPNGRKAISDGYVLLG